MVHNNTVELLGFYGGDVSHATSAWTSTSRELNEDKIARIPKLLKMLADNRHFSPFEKSSIHFLVTTDVASHIHIIKHRIGVSVNAESARYKELKEDKYLLPEDWGDATYQLNNAHISSLDGDKWSSILEQYTKKGNYLYHKCLEDLTPVLGRKRAKESARFFKTYNSQITADVMFNFKSFAHFQSLRNKPDAQLEIQNIAQEMLDLVKAIDGNPFEHSISAFGL
jgi:flavin-dependent thymidylate synthase